MIGSHHHYTNLFEFLFFVYTDNINHRKDEQSFQTGRKARIHRCMFLEKMHIVENILD